MKDFSFAVFPLARLRVVRREHALKYVNNRDFDYAFKHFQVVPWCIEHWSCHGLHLDQGLVEELWSEFSNKKGINHKAGEINRAKKLVLDAYRGLWDMAATAHFSGLDVRYSASLDMNGIDVQVMTQPKPIFIQFSVSASSCSDDYISTKQVRRIRRGAAEFDVLRLEARHKELDRRYQPWVPVDEWYEQLGTRVFGRPNASHTSRNQCQLPIHRNQLVAYMPTLFDAIGNEIA